MGMLHPKTLLEYPEDEPELVLESLPVGPLKARRRGCVGIRELTVITITEAGSDASTTLTSAPGKRKSNLNSLSLPLSAVVGSLSGRATSFLSPQVRNHRVKPSIMLHRKSSRYESAHRALIHRSGNLPPETSPEDLRVQTLQRATTFLHDQIQETQEYAEQLRRHLADRDTHFVEHQCYQREKWRTDRRLATLKVLMESARAQYRTTPKELEDETTSLSARKQANLTSFFQRASRKAPLRFNCAVTGKALERRVLKQVSPLLLKPSTPSTRTSSLWSPSDLPPLYARRKQPEKMISMASIREERWASSPSCYSTTEDTSVSGLSPRTISDENIGTMHDGIALILSPALRPAEDIIAEMGDIPLPAYALNLLEDFDYVHDKVPPRPESSRLDGSSSLLFITPLDWEYPPRDPSFVSPRRTATVRIPDRRLADALLSSPETEGSPRKRGHAHKVSLDPAFFKDDSRSEKLGEAAPTRHSTHITAEEGRKPMGLLKRKSSAMFSMVSKTPDRRETAPSTPRKNIVSLVKRRMPSINRFR